MICIFWGLVRGQHPAVPPQIARVFLHQLGYNHVSRYWHTRLLFQIFLDQGLFLIKPPRNVRRFWRYCNRHTAAMYCASNRNKLPRREETRRRCSTVNSWLFKVYSCVMLIFVSIKIRMACLLQVYLLGCQVKDEIADVRHHRDGPRLELSSNKKYPWWVILDE